MSEQQERVRVEPLAADVEIGSRLRSERLRRALSLRELARRLGVSASLISQIETGKSKPSVSTLYLIVSELGVSLDQLLTRADRGGRAVGEAAGQAGAQDPQAGAQDPLCPVQRAADRRVIDLDSGVRWERLTPGPDPHVEFLYCTYDVGGASSRDGTLIRHPGREYGLVVQGRLTVAIAFDRYDLEPGDSVTLDSTIPHLYENKGDVPVHFVNAVVGRRQ